MNNKALPWFLCAVLIGIGLLIFWPSGGGPARVGNPAAARPGSAQQGPPAPQPASPGATKPGVKTGAPTGPKAPKPNGHPKPPATPQRAACPVGKPEIVPDSVAKTFSSDPLVTFDERRKELRALAKGEKDGAAAMALRWLVHQPDTGQALRNEVLLTLGAWHPPWLVDDLCGMMRDPLQPKRWRVNCAKHLGLYHRTYLDEASYPALEQAAGNAKDPAVRNVALEALGQLCREFRYSRTHPENFKRLLEIVSKALEARDSSTLQSAIGVVAHAELKRYTPRLEALAADPKRPLALRVAAVRALAGVARPESLSVLDICARSGKKALADAADAARPFALVAGLDGPDAKTLQGAYTALAKLGGQARPALEKAMNAEERGKGWPYVHGLLAEIFLKQYALKPIVQTGLKPFGANPKKGLPGRKNVRLNAKARRIVIDGEFPLEQGPLEYAVVAKGENAKLHETAVALLCSPMDIIYALFKCRYVYAGELRDNGRVHLPPGAGVMLSVEYDFKKQTPKGVEKRRVRIPLELLIWNETTGRPMKRAPWAFTGSRWKRDPATGKQVLMAAIEKSVAAIMSDPNAILNTPLDTAELANVSGDRANAYYVVNRPMVPRRGAKLQLIFEPWTGKELKPEDVDDRGPGEKEKKITPPRR